MIYDEKTQAFLREPDTIRVLDELHDSEESIETLCRVLNMKSRRMRYVVMKLTMIGLIEERGTRMQPHNLSGRPQVLYGLTKTRKAA